MKFFVKDFWETVEAGVVIFCMQDYNDIFYCGISNQLFVAYSSQHLSNFLSFHTMKNEIFLQRFCKTVQARVVIFGMLVDNDVLYHGNVNQPSHSFFSLDLSDFVSFHTFNNEVFCVKDFCETLQSYLVCRLIMMNCIVGL